VAAQRVPAPLCGTSSEPIDSGTLALTCTPAPGSVGIAGMDATGKLGATIRRAMNYLPAEAGSKLMSLLTPEALAALAGVLVVWAGSHAVGIGEAIDVLLLATGLIFVGREALDAIEHLAAFAKLALRARTDTDVDAAARDLARAVSIIGVNAVIVLLTHSGAKSYRGWYRPIATGDATIAAGEGRTSKFGDITYSTAGSESEQALVLHHERVHSFLSHGHLDQPGHSVACGAASRH
jgi:hypothetical protein